jgi:hypothetical protein
MRPGATSASESCCCGAQVSITTEHASRADDALRRFREDHAPCREAYRAAVSFAACASPRSTASEDQAAASASPGSAYTTALPGQPSPS